MNHFDEFEPDMVEEQIAQLSQGETEPSASSEVVRALQGFYEHDASMIDRVWRRLESARQESADQEASLLEEKRYERISPMQISLNIAESRAAYNPSINLSKSKKRSLSRYFTLLASAIVGVIIISSIAFALNLFRQNTGQPGGTGSPVIQHTSPTSTSVTKPDPSGIYLVNALGVYRLDRASGKQIWFYDIKADPNTKPSATHRVTTPLLLNNGLAYFGGNDFESDNYNSYYLYALNATTGKLLWRQPVSSELNALLKDERGIIYASTVEDSGYAFNGNGSIRWSQSFSTGALSPRQFVQLEQGVLYADNGETISAIRANNGQQIWAKSSPAGGNIGGIKVVSGVLYATNYISSTGSSGEVIRTSYVQAYQASTGAPVWQSQPIDQSLFAAPVIANGLVYAGSYTEGSGVVYALDARNGHVKWQRNASYSILAPLSVSGNTVIAGTAGGSGAEIIAYNATTGNQKWSHPSTSFESPNEHYMIVTASRIYYAAPGSVHVLNLTSGQQIAEFPVGDGQRSSLTVVE